MRRLLAALAAACLMACAPLTARADSIPTVKDVKALMASKGLSGKVRTQGNATADDGAGTVWEIVGSKPDSADGNMGVPTANGKWAIPVPTAQPSRK